jgi:hypothetical protein
LIAIFDGTTALMKLSKSAKPRALFITMSWTDMPIRKVPLDSH